MNIQWMPLFGRDFLTATLGWSAEERGHYVVLLIAQWEQGGLPAEPARLELISPGCRSCWATLAPKFPIGADGRRANPRLERERAAAAARSERARESAARRWSASAPAAIGADAAGNAEAYANAYTNAYAARTPPAAASLSPGSLGNLGDGSAGEASEGGSDAVAAGKQCGCDDSDQQSAEAAWHKSDVPSICGGICSGDASTMNSPPPPPPILGDLGENPASRAEIVTSRAEIVSSRAESAAGVSAHAAGWPELRSAWNAVWTGKRQWQSSRPPPEAVARLAEPGWLADALLAIPQLRRGLCAGFRTPPTLRQFCARDRRGTFVERLLGGEFTDAPREVQPAWPRGLRGA